MTGDRSRKPMLRADSAFYGRATIRAAVRAGADVSVTVRLDPKVKKASSTIADEAWTAIEYPDAVFDDSTGRWISRAEVAEIPYTAFAGDKTRSVPGRLVVRRIPDLNPRAKDGQESLFDTWRFHAFFTTTDPALLDTLAADVTHRAHAVIEQVHADLKNSALAHLPSGKFTANAAWLVLAVIAFNLTRAAATLTRSSRLAEATTATIRRTPHHRPGPSRILRPQNHPAPAHGMALAGGLDRAVHPLLRATSNGHSLTTQPATAPQETSGERADSEVSRSPCPQAERQHHSGHGQSPRAIGGSGLSACCLALRLSSVCRHPTASRGNHQRLGRQPLVRRGHRVHGLAGKRSPALRSPARSRSSRRPWPTDATTASSVTSRKALVASCTSPPTTQR
jgi:hypothetical protein